MPDNHILVIEPPLPDEPKPPPGTPMPTEPVTSPPVATPSPPVSAAPAVIAAVEPAEDVADLATAPIRMRVIEPRLPERPTPPPGTEITPPPTPPKEGTEA